MRKKINWLVNLTRSILRILCVFTLFHWFFFTSYANCTSYYESINKAESHKEQVEYGKDNQQTIEEIEEKILKEIEAKRKTSGLKREWKDKWLSELERAEKEKEKPDSSEKEKKEYDEKLEKAKEATIKNIQDQLRGNNLDITELDDQRAVWERIWYDPLKFFFISPLNRINKVLSGLLDLQEPFLVEIIFKLLIVKLFFAFFINYSEKEARDLSKRLERMQDPSLSVEEKEEIQQETSPLVWRGIFNFSTALLILFLVYHPCFVDRNSSHYLTTSPWWKWALPMIGVTFISSIINEFLHQGRILKIKEIKEYLAKSWLSITIISLLLNIVLPYCLPAVRNTYGFQLIILCSGLIDIVINMIEAVIIQRGKKEPKLE
jgi:hypothetical protein